MSTFDEVSSSSAEETERILFEKAVPATPFETEDRIRNDYEHLQRSWGTKMLVENTEPIVRSVVLRNLQRIASEPGFEEFVIIVDNRDVKFAQVNAFFSSSFVPMRVWRCEHKIFACGNSLFK